MRSQSWTLMMMRANDGCVGRDDADDDADEGMAYLLRGRLSLDRAFHGFQKGSLCFYSFCLLSISLFSLKSVCSGFRYSRYSDVEVGGGLIIMRFCSS